MLRHRVRAGNTAPVRLLYSARSLPDVIYRGELDQAAEGVMVVYTLTRQQPPGWTGHSGRVDAAFLGEVAWPPDGKPLAFVCGPTAFVETAAADSGWPGLSAGPDQDRAVRRSGSDPMSDVLDGSAYERSAYDGSAYDGSALDGNAIGGLLQEVFGTEMTTAAGTCANLRQHQPGGRDPGLPAGSGRRHALPRLHGGPARDHPAGRRALR